MRLPWGVLPGHFSKAPKVIMLVSLLAMIVIRHPS